MHATVRTTTVIAAFIGVDTRATRVIIAATVQLHSTLLEEHLPANGITAGIVLGSEHGVAIPSTPMEPTSGDS